MSLLAPPEPFVDIDTVAEHLGMSRSWVEKRLAAGMPCYHFGRAVRLKLSEVEEWLATGVPSS